MTRWFSHADLRLRLGQATLESLWLHGCVAMFANLRTSAVRFDFAPLAGLAVAAVLAARASERLPFRVGMNRLALLAVSGALIASWVEVTARTSPLAWALAIYLCVRGLLIGLQPAGVGTARWFVAGAVMWVLSSAAVARIAMPVTTDQLDTLRASMLCYFAGGILLLATAHRTAVLQQAHVRRTFSPSWLVAIAVPLAIIGGAAIALASASSTLRVILELSQQVTDRVGSWAVELLSWLGSLLGALLRWLGALFGADAASRARTPVETRTATPSELGCQPDARHPAGSISGDPAPYLFLAALAIGVLWLLRVLLTARAPREGATVQEREESESLWSWSLFVRQLSGFWSALFASWSATASQLFDRVAPRGDRATEPTRDIRAVYRALLRWAARNGQRRPPSVTPLELADRLARELGPSEPVQLITAHYLEARYGEIATRPEDVENARRALEQLSERPKPGS